MASFLKSFLVIGSLIAGSIGLTLPAEAKAPSGSYQETCRNIHYRNLGTPKARLNADCQRRDGSWNPSKLDVSKCRGDIGNDNGKLVCASGGGGSKAKLPRGSWSDSCRNARMVGDRLIADCKRRDGGWTTSAIRADKCRKNVANDNGRLVCDDDRVRPLPRGSWQETCRKGEIRGDRLVAECRRMNGKWRDTDIRYERCRRDIRNIDGRLQCD